MIPLRDQNPTTRFPLVTVILIAVNVVAFLFELGLEAQGQLMSFFDSWAVIPVQLTTNPGPELPSVFSAMFLHGGWSHLIGNMLYLWIFGDNVEEDLGSGRFLLFYLACGVIATAAQVLIDPASPIPNIGASGAIAGVLGGYLVLYPRAHVITLIPLVFFYRLARIPAIIVLGFWFVLQLFNGVVGLQTVQMEGGGVAFFAHVGGFVAGFLLVRLLYRRPSPRHTYWERNY